LILRAAKYSVLIIVFLCVTGVSAYLTLAYLIKSENRVIVPDLVGRDVVYALEILTDLGLNIKVKRSEYSSDIAKNHVIVQEPGPGEEIKSGRDVRILLSKGTKTILMPDLTGLSIRRARLAIQENGLCGGQVSYTHHQKDFARDDIISQTPGPGQWVHRGSCVDLLVSLGSPLHAYKMDNLRGLTLNEAVNLIEKSSLVVGNIKYSFDSTKPEHTIIDHSPKYGYRVTEKTLVDLIVNQNPNQPKSAAGFNASLQSVFNYRLAAGFFKKRVQIHLNIGGVVGEIYDNLLMPGKEVWLVVPSHTKTTILCYVDGELVRSQLYNPD
jgi:beta-lactam-binding protein with PASTA domain